jgi:hypothetical protein
MCSFCKFGSYEGNACDGTGEYMCDHPLESVSDEYGACEKAWEMEDCWGFRPRYSVTLCADIVGVILENEFGGTTWEENGKTIKVYGISHKIGENE